MRYFDAQSDYLASMLALCHVFYQLINEETRTEQLATSNREHAFKSIVVRALLLGHCAGTAHTNHELAING